MVFHGFWLVSIVLLVENTTKLYPGPTIQSRPCRPKASFGLVKMMKNHLERCARKPVTISRGRRTRTVIQLNRSVMMAAVKPSLYSLLCLMW